MQGRENLEPSRKERPAASAGAGQAGIAGQDDTREVAGTRPGDAEPPGVMVGAGFILNVVSSHQRGVTM